MALLRWLESVRTPVLNAVMSVLTHGGSEALFLLLVLTIFWCVNKKTAYYVLVVGYTGIVLNQFLKLWFRIPRPWVLDPAFTIVESARAGATGYSFPSGHTQLAVGTYGCLLLSTRKKWVRALCAALLLLVPFSRMYLGVHTPLDVGVSFAAAAILVLLYKPVVDRAVDNPRRMSLLLSLLAALGAAYLAFALLYPFPADVDPENLTDGIKNAGSLAGAILGFLAGYWIDRRWIRFSERAPLPLQLVKVLGGLILVLGAKSLLKTPLAALLPLVPASALRYFLVVLLASAGWPALFTRLFRQKNETAK